MPRSRALLALAPACAALLVGCSAIPKAAAMRVDDVTRARTLPASVEVHVSGGQDFDFRVSDAQFEQALRESLAESGVFSRVADRAADYRLDVVLGDDAGVEGREITVLWSLSHRETGETVWQELIASKGKSFQFVGVVRLRRSIEMAAKENIQLGIERLSHLDLPR
jgi:hypothetical protein